MYTFSSPRKNKQDSKNNIKIKQKQTEKRTKEQVHEIHTHTFAHIETP